ncbi:hypothetical protein BH20ACI3_BH20ACI3_38090 [soil metagenome]
MPLLEILTVSKPSEFSHVPVQFQRTLSTACLLLLTALRSDVRVCFCGLAFELAATARVEMGTCGVRTVLADPAIAATKMRSKGRRVVSLVRFLFINEG